MIIWNSVNDTEGKGFPFPHPLNEAQSDIRKLHFANSRLALINCLKELKPQAVEIQEIGQLEIVQHHHLKNFPNLLVSLAHTRGMAAACVAPKSESILAIGIDCESLERRFNENILEKFSTDEDSFQNILELWCAKEAAFKAASFFWQHEKTFILKDIVIQKNQFFVKGILAGEFTLEQKDRYLFAIAKVTQLS